MEHNTPTSETHHSSVSSSYFLRNVSTLQISPSPSPKASLFVFTLTLLFFYNYVGLDFVSVTPVVLAELCVAQIRNKSQLEELLVKESARAQRVQGV